MHGRRRRRLSYVVPFVERQLDVVVDLLGVKWRDLPPCNLSVPLYRADVDLVLYANRVLGTTAREHEAASEQLRAALRRSRANGLCDPRFDSRSNSFTSLSSLSLFVFFIRMLCQRARARRQRFAPRSRRALRHQAGRRSVLSSACAQVHRCVFGLHRLL